ncbi:TRAP transporter small permease subunit [Pelagibius sp. CAU 1746]|uniref:TRAP transporter small permease n=1 Tax=Pelagibius sp. CAU 1746 TaxID=3140370 RepID=UPI00325B0983
MAVLRWLDANVEKIIILVCYVVMAGIIFVEVIRRFLFNEQVAWSTTVPVYLFLWIVWLGCAYNVKIRAHLRFDELRLRLPYAGQFLCLCLDALLWIAFAVIVIVYTSEQVWLSYDNFAIVQGTDDVMQWWFYMATPFAWSVLVIRVLQNFHHDLTLFRRGEPFHLKTSIFGD